MANFFLVNVAKYVLYVVVLVVLYVLFITVDHLVYRFRLNKLIRKGKEQMNDENLMIENDYFQINLVTGYLYRESLLHELSLETNSSSTPLNALVKRNDRELFREIVFEMQNNLPAILKNRRTGFTKLDSSLFFPLFIGFITQQKPNFQFQAEELIDLILFYDYCNINFSKNEFFYELTSKLTDNITNLSYNQKRIFIDTVNNNKACHSPVTNLLKNTTSISDLCIYEIDTIIKDTILCLKLSQKELFLLELPFFMNQARGALINECCITEETMRALLSFSLEIVYLSNCTLENFENQLTIRTYAFGMINCTWHNNRRLLKFENINLFIEDTIQIISIEINAKNTAQKFFLNDLESYYELRDENLRNNLRIYSNNNNKENNDPSTTTNKAENNISTNSSNDNNRENNDGSTTTNEAENNACDYNYNDLPTLPFDDYRFTQENREIVRNSYLMRKKILEKPYFYYNKDKLRMWNLNFYDCEKEFLIDEQLEELKNISELSLKTIYGITSIFNIITKLPNLFSLSLVQLNEDDLVFDPLIPDNQNYALRILKMRAGNITRQNLYRNKALMDSLRSFVLLNRDISSSEMSTIFHSVNPDIRILSLRPYNLSSHYFSSIEKYAKNLRMLALSIIPSNVFVENVRSLAALSMLEFLFLVIPQMNQGVNETELVNAIFELHCKIVVIKLNDFYFDTTIVDIAEQKGMRAFTFVNGNELPIRLYTMIGDILIKSLSDVNAIDLEDSKKGYVINVNDMVEFKENSDIYDERYFVFMKNCDEEMTIY